MQAKRIWVIAAGFLAVAAAGPATAATKVQGNLVAVDDGANEYNIAKPGKFAFKESTAAGGGGMTVQLVLKGVDCGAPSDPGKCDKDADAAHGPDNVMELTIAFNGAALETHTGLLFDLIGGKAVFPQTGKNKVTGADVFGVIASVTQGATVGIGTTRIHGTASVPSDCDFPLLLPGNGCNDGETYAISGVIPSNAPGTGPSCTTNTDCDSVIPVLACVSSSCVIESCTQDADCHLNGINVDVACNETAGTCCLLSSGDPDCDVGP